MARKKKLVRMRRKPDYEGEGPLTADVHPDEVDDYLKHDWEPVPDSK